MFFTSLATVFFFTIILATLGTFNVLQFTQWKFYNVIKIYFQTTAFFFFPSKASCNSTSVIHTVYPYCAYSVKRYNGSYRKKSMPFTLASMKLLHRQALSFEYTDCHCGWTQKYSAIHKTIHTVKALDILDCGNSHRCYYNHL